MLENQVFQKHVLSSKLHLWKQCSEVNTLKEAYELAKNSPGTIVTDMPVYRGEEFGLEERRKSSFIQ